MSDFKPQFVPTVFTDRSIQLEADWVKGQDTAALKTSKRGNNIGLTAWLNDPGKNRIQAVFKPAGFFILMEAVRRIARDPNAPPLRLQVDADTKKGNDGKIPKTIVSVGRCSKTQRVFIGMIDAQNETLRKQFFFKMPGFSKMMGGDGNPVGGAMESEIAAPAWATMYEKLAAHIMVTDYRAPPKGGYGNRGGGNGGGNNYRGGGNNGGGGQQQQAAAPPAQGGETNDFQDGDFTF